MTRRTRIWTISAAAALGLVALAVGVSAATSHGWSGKRYGMAMACAQGGERIEDMVTFAEIRLNITDAQQPQWTAFADTVRKNGARMLENCPRLKTLRSAAAPERFAQIENVMADALTATRAIRAGFDPLYAVLDDDQKATIERLTRRNRQFRRYRQRSGDGDGG